MSTPTRIHIDWTGSVRASRTTLTTHVWSAPPMRRGAALHDVAYRLLADLDT